MRLLALALALAAAKEAPPRSWQKTEKREGIVPDARRADGAHPGGAPLSSTTTPAVPELFRAAIKTYGPVDEAATDYLPAEASVRKMESQIGWDADESKFVREPAAIHALQREGLAGPREHHRGGVAMPEDADAELRARLPALLDVVIPSIRHLDFLDSWRPYLEGLHLIIVQDGDPDKFLEIPAWADYELFNRRDVEAALGADAWIISQKDASVRNFGFLASKKRLVYTVDDDCRPATGPDGRPVDAVLEHARNLLSPATPYFFNTVYDPFKRGSDFVRGFPYSLRRGVATAVSHGLWLHNYDYDAPTQLLKVHEKNEVYAAATVTVPKGVLYPLCSMNVAFDRALIGPAFMQGLMGVGQPWGRYDDMWAGWASKTVADHLGLGCKSGHPYIKHNKASNPFTNLLKEYKGLEWQESVIRFFDTVRLSEASAADAGDAYVDLSWHVHTELGKLNPYFERLGLAMRTWVKVWRAAERGDVAFVPSRRSGAGPVAPARAAVPPAASRVTAAAATASRRNATAPPPRFAPGALRCAPAKIGAAPGASCELTFPSCASYAIVDPARLRDATVAAAVASLAQPAPSALLVKCGAGAPFAGDRAERLTGLAVDVANAAARGDRAQLVFLVDASRPPPEGARVFPEPLERLAVRYTSKDVDALFPSPKDLSEIRPAIEEYSKGAFNAKNVRARASSKYYETASWTWWWAARADRAKTARVWVAEDDVHFTGDWGALLATLNAGLASVNPDLTTFNPFRTPPGGWPWKNWMHEGWSGLDAKGQGLMSWMTLYGVSAKFLDALSGAQRRGVTGHIEWFPATFALRNGFTLATVRHARAGSKDGTFNFCCQGAATAQAETFYQGFKTTGTCAPQIILHPIKHDTCARFSPNGFGEGCWARKAVPGEGFVDYKKPYAPNKALPALSAMPAKSLRAVRVA